jgi:signal transduction histidine kinase
MSEALALEQQRSLNAVIDASEEERQTIGRELHDSVGQQLSALKFLIESEPKASAILDSSIQEVRQISQRMLPVTLRHSGLDAALRELTENSFRHTPLAATYESWDLPTDMSEKGALQVYCIAQELISNVLRHSGATQFQLLFYKAGAQLILRSEDNGVGNPTIAGKAGMGRSNIRARALNLNAGLSEEHAVKGGWVTTVRIPLQSLQS